MYAHSGGRDLTKSTPYVSEIVKGFWNKHHAVLKYLDHYEWVLYVDSDTIIRDEHFSLKAFVSDIPSDIHVVLSELHFSGAGGFDGGVFLVRNSDEGYSFLYDWLDTQATEWTNADNGALNTVFLSRFVPTRDARECNKMMLKKNEKSYQEYFRCFYKILDENAEALEFRRDPESLELVHANKYKPFLVHPWAGPNLLSSALKESNPIVYHNKDIANVYNLHRNCPDKDLFNLCHPSDKYFTLQMESGSLCPQISLELWRKVKHAFQALNVFVEWHNLELTGNVGLRPFQTLKYLEKTLKHKSTNINLCETGFNAGHSALAFLLTRNDLNYYGFDIGTEFSAAKSCSKRLSVLFPERVHLTWGDSLKSVPQYFQETNPSLKCDILHVDGLHTYDGVYFDLKNFHDHLSESAVILIDDMADKPLHDPVVDYVKKHGYGMECFMYHDDKPASQGFCIVYT
eukprot:COSAG01_NODE_12612_length_1711_cov_1.763027_1_plen_458_part_00